MQYSELLTLIGDLTNDPNSERYTTAQRATELNNTQNSWNVEARIIKDTVTLTVIDGTRTYAITGLTGTVIAFGRVTHKGLELSKRDKSWFDLYAGDDWTLHLGTPSSYLLEVTDPDNQFVTIYPTPQSADAGAYLTIEYIKAHTPMSADTDVPFMSGTSSNSLLRPYDWGLAYDVAGRLLSRDPSEVNVVKSANFNKIANGVLGDVIQVFSALEKEEPMRLRGGRFW